MARLRPELLIAQSRRPDAMRKRRNGRVTTKISIEVEIAHLRGLDLKGLRARWQSVLQRPAPDHLPRHLLFAIMAYRIAALGCRRLCRPGSRVSARSGTHRRTLQRIYERSRK